MHQHKNEIYYTHKKKRNHRRNHSQKIYNQNSTEQHHRRNIIAGQHVRNTCYLVSIFLLSSLRSSHLIWFCCSNTKHVVPCSVHIIAYIFLSLCVCCTFCRSSQSEEEKKNPIRFSILILFSFDAGFCFRFLCD